MTIRTIGSEIEQSIKNNFPRIKKYLDKKIKKQIKKDDQTTIKTDWEKMNQHDKKQQKQKSSKSSKNTILLQIYALTLRDREKEKAMKHFFLAQAFKNAAPKKGSKSTESRNSTKSRVEVEIIKASFIFFIPVLFVSFPRFFLLSSRLPCLFACWFPLYRHHHHQDHYHCHNCYDYDYSYFFATTCATLLLFFFPDVLPFPPFFPLLPFAPFLSFLHSLRFLPFLAFISFLHCFFPSHLPFLPSFPSSFLPSFLPSCLPFPSHLPSCLPPFFPPFLPFCSCGVNFFYPQKSENSRVWGLFLRDIWHHPVDWSIWTCGFTDLNFHRLHNLVKIGRNKDTSCGCR